jgi:hypothetical protein
MRYPPQLNQTDYWAIGRVKSVNVPQRSGELPGSIPEWRVPMPEPIKSPAAEQPRPDPNEKLVKVFDSEQESEALVVKGLLDSAGIESDLTSASMVQDTFPGLGGMIILVRREDAEEARRLIAETQRPFADDDETAEIAIIQDPPQKP